MRIEKLEDQKEKGSSHNPEIKIKEIIEKGYIPGLTGLRLGTLQPGQIADKHVHPSMYEVFFVLSGRARFRSEGEEVEVTEGDTVVISPGEVHNQNNPYSEPVVWIYFGIATD